MFVYLFCIKDQISKAKIKVATGDWDIIKVGLWVPGKQHLVLYLVSVAVNILK